MLIDWSKGQEAASPQASSQSYVWERPHEFVVASIDKIKLFIIDAFAQDNRVNKSRANSGR